MNPYPNCSEPPGLPKKANTDNEQNINVDEHTYKYEMNPYPNCHGAPGSPEKGENG